MRAETILRAVKGVLPVTDESCGRNVKITYNLLNNTDSQQIKSMIFR